MATPARAFATTGDRLFTTWRVQVAPRTRSEQLVALQQKHCRPEFHGAVKLMTGLIKVRYDKEQYVEVETKKFRETYCEPNPIECCCVTPYNEQTQLYEEWGYIDKGQLWQLLFVAEQCAKAGAIFIVKGNCASGISREVRIQLEKVRVMHTHAPPESPLAVNKENNNTAANVTRENPVERMRKWDMEVYEKQPMSFKERMADTKARREREEKAIRAQQQQIEDIGAQLQFPSTYWEYSRRRADARKNYEADEVQRFNRLLCTHDRKFSEKLREAGLLETVVSLGRSRFGWQWAPYAAVAGPLEPGYIPERIGRVFR